MKRGITPISKKDVFVVLPYLKTTQCVLLRSILFRSSDDLEGLSPVQQTHLKTLFALFFLRNDIHIKRMIYAHFELSEDREVNWGRIWRLYEARTLINYVYSSPQPTTGDPFLHREYASMYVFTVAKVYSGLIWSNDPHVDDNVENITEDELPYDKDIDGYSGVLNSDLHFWVTAGNRLYPPVPHFTLNNPQYLWFDLGLFAEESKNWAWVDFLQEGEHQNTELAGRLKNLPTPSTL